MIGVAAALRPGARRRRLGRVGARPTRPRRARPSTLLSLRYGLPTLPFVARRGRGNGLVGDQALIDRRLRRRRLRRRRAAAAPRRRPRRRAPASRARDATRAAGAIVTITLCGDRRGRTPMHRVAIGGRDPEVAARARRRLGSPCAGAARLDELALRDLLQGLRGRCDASPIASASTPRCRVRYAARLGAPVAGMKNSLPFMPAASVRPGHGDVHRGRRLRRRRDASSASSSTARSTTSTSRARTTSSPTGSSPTTRSTRFRGADITNILDFQDDFPDAQVVRLEQNYRSTQTILDAANAVIAHNRGRMGKSLWTDLGEGDPVKVRELEDEHAEARFVVGEIERLVDEGVSRAEIAVFYRTNAQSRVLEDTLVRARDRLPGHRRHEVLRARRDQGRDRLPDGAGQPAGRRRRSRASPTRRGAGSGRRRCRACSTHADTMGIPVWDAAAEPERGARPRHRGASGRFERFMATMARPARARRAAASRSATCSTRSCTRPATSTRSRPSARSRRRGASRTSRSSSRSAREFDAARRGATRSTTSCSRSRWSPTPTRAATTRAS